jgi:hypothetical protein
MSVCVSPLSLLVNGSVRKNPLVVARQHLGRNVIVVTNTHEIEELLDTSFSMRSVSYQGK